MFREEPLVYVIGQMRWRARPGRHGAAEALGDHGAGPPPN